MFHKPKPEVLVVGAGPVGLMAAITLSEAGIPCEIIDQDVGRSVEHGFALAIHPGTLNLLKQIDTAAEVVERGRRIDTVGLFDCSGRQATLDLGRLKSQFPFAATLPQVKLEAILRKRLQQYKVKVQWCHRLTGLSSQAECVTARVDRGGMEPGGYAVAGGNWLVEKTTEHPVRFVIGADGQHSMVRQRSGLAFETIAQPELFAVMDLRTEAAPGHEIQLALDEDSAVVVWPIGDRGCRVSIQLRKGEMPAVDGEPVFYAQDRSVLALAHRDVLALLHDRAPWFKLRVEKVDWSVAARFERRLASEFGRGNCWLAGDAAHVASPIGAQSMNVGMREARELGFRLARVLRGEGSRNLLDDYAAERRTEWRGLMGLEQAVVPGKDASSWIVGRAVRLLSCVPGSGADLKCLLSSMGLEPAVPGALEAS